MRLYRDSPDHSRFRKNLARSLVLARRLAAMMVAIRQSKNRQLELLPFLRPGGIYIGEDVQGAFNQFAAKFRGNPFLK